MTTQNSGCLSALLGLFRSGNKQNSIAGTIEEVEKLPYALRDDFFSNAEASFFHVLKNHLSEGYNIFSKVALSEIFFVSHPEINQPYYNKINRKHVDFLLCDEKTLHPVLGIELDDSSHRRADRVERDDFVDRVFATAGLPLLRVPARSTYNTDELDRWIQNALSGEITSKGVAHQEIEGTPIEAAPPLCPKCEIPMLLRTARQGANAGKQFYGCPNYPRCKEVIPV